MRGGFDKVVFVRFNINCSQTVLTEGLVAQVVGGTNFDFAWDGKTNRCLILLREAADFWATKGRNALDPEKVLAAFLQVLAEPVRWRSNWPARFFTDTRLEFWLPQQSCQCCRELAPKRSTEDVATSIELLDGLLREVADLWALGDPENPSTKQVLDSILEVMWNRHLAPRPPSRAYPEGL